MKESMNYYTVTVGNKYNILVSSPQTLTEVNAQCDEYRILTKYSLTVSPGNPCAIEEYKVMPLDELSLILGYIQCTTTIEEMFVNYKQIADNLHAMRYSFNLSDFDVDIQYWIAVDPMTDEERHFFRFITSDEQERRRIVEVFNRRLSAFTRGFAKLQPSRNPEIYYIKKRCSREYGWTVHVLEEYHFDVSYTSQSDINIQVLIKWYEY